MQDENRTSNDDEIISGGEEAVPAALDAALLLLENGRYQDARRLLEESLQNGSETVAAPTHWCLGWAYALNAEWDSAIHTFDRAVRLAPNQPESFLYLGEMYRCRGDLQGACEMWWRALTLAWQRENSLVVQIAAAFLASVQVNADGTPEEVIRQHLVLVIKSPGWTDGTVHASQIPFLLSLTGNLLIQSRQYSTAASLLRDKTKGRSGFAPDTYRLACAHEHLGRRSEAAKAYGLTLAKEPTHRCARRALCRIELRRFNLPAAYHLVLLYLTKR